MSSTTATNEEILTLAAQAKNFVPLAADRLPAGFLTLAPTTSASYPQRKASVPEAAVGVAVPAVAQDAAVAAVTPAAADSALVEAKQRRSSSQSSAGLRFLKLGPVHWGEHLGEHQDDFHEVAVEESS